MLKIIMPVKRKKETIEPFARVRVIGVGGSGKNAINHMVRSKLDGVEFIIANTDSQDIEQSLTHNAICIGKQLTRGLGTGMNSDLGKEAAEQSTDMLKGSLKGADLVFIACGMGGGTGTGASPVIANIAKDLGALVVAVVTTPFAFEGKRRMALAREGIKNLSESVDSIVIIPNENLIHLADKTTSMADSFALSDDVLLKAVHGISDLITRPGLINVDFADLKAIMYESGIASMGVGHGNGPNRTQLALEDAIRSPVIGMPIQGAKRALFSIASKTANDITMLEVQDIASTITNLVSPEAQIIFGTTLDSSLKVGDVRVTVVATAIDRKNIQEKEEPAPETPPATVKNQNTVPNSKVTIIGDSIPDDETDEDFEEDTSDRSDNAFRLWRK